MSAHRKAKREREEEEAASRVICGGGGERVQHMGRRWGSMGREGGCTHCVS